MGLKQGEGIDEELHVGNVTDDRMSGSVRGTAGGARADWGSGNSVRPGASSGGVVTPEEPLAPLKKQPKVSLAACIGSAPVVPSLLKTLTTSKTLFAKKGAAFKEAGFQVRKMAKDMMSKMLDEGGYTETEGAVLLAKVSDLEGGVAEVVQTCADGVELVARTIAAVDDVIRDTNEVGNVSFGHILRIFCVLYHHR
jgi:hypothetical protein